MLTMLSAIFGFAAPFLPELVKLFQAGQDNRHELAMTELRLKHAQAEHLWRMEEVSAQADIAEASAIRQPAPSFGVQILDRAADAGWSPWLVVPVFWLFAAMDFLAGMVRPTIAYAAFGFYVAYKWAVYLTLTGPRFEAPPADALAGMWGEQDWAMLTLVLSYWFGQRAVKAAFGGSASHAARS